MLNFLRAKQHNIFVKIFLGVITFLLVGFFGVRNSKNLTEQADQLATVNDVSISRQMVEYKLKQKIAQLQQVYNMEEFPPNLVDSLRNNTLDNVIELELMRQNIQALGLDTQDAELSQKIKDTFVENGAFNRDYYLNEVVPGYQAETGHAFEDDFRVQLATEKVYSAFDGLFKMSDEEALRAYNWQNTKFRYVVVKVAKFKKSDSAAPETTDTTKTPPTEEPDVSATLTANQIFDQWSKGGDIGKLLKPFNLTQKITGDLNPIQLERVFDGDASLEDLVAIAKLTAAQPFPATVFEKEKFFYIVKLDAKTPAPEKPDAQALTDLKNNYENEMTNNLQSAWTDALRDKAKINRAPKT